MTTGTSSLPERELLALTRIGKIWVCASYWEDEAIKRYRELGLVTPIGDRISLTGAGKQAVRCAGRYTQQPPAGGVDEG
jgi:hypothetical protein